MNKLTLVIIVLVVIVGGVLATVMIRNKKTNTVDVTVGDGATVAIDSRSILTENIAKTILGDASAKGDLPAASQVSTKDVSVSDCVYTAKIDPVAAVRIANTKGVTLLVRSAKTNAGIKSNQDQFGSFKPAGVQDISGFGEAAFFNPQYGQLNVLKDGNWYIVTSYSGSANGTLELDKTLATALGL